MRRITDFLVRHRKATIGFFVLAILVSCLLYPLVSVNYSLQEYLPETSMTRRAISEMEQSFGYPGSARVMAKDVTIAQALEIKAKIESVEGVQSVLWLDDVADLSKPLQTLGTETTSQYYKESAALFQVTFIEHDYATSTGEAIESIRALGIDNLYVTGNAEDSRNMRATVSSEISTIMIVVVPFCVLILLFASSAWVEPPLYLLVLAISIIINAGTNAFFTNISFITHAMAAVLQLAISLDYSLFLFHRYLEERDEGKDAREAVLSATSKSFTSILSSALTTVAGFLALVAMEYTFGRDIGFVLAKGICISLITVMTLMPVLIYMLRNVIDKTRHKRLIPSFNKLGKGSLKMRWVLLALVIVVLVPSYLAQSKTSYLYGNSSGSSQNEDITSERETVEALFGVYNPVAMLVPSGDIAKEVALAGELTAQEGVSSVQTLVTLADPSIPREILPKSITGQFESDAYTRMIVNFTYSSESEELYQAVDEMKEAADTYYGDEWLAAGEPTGLTDIRQSVENDGIRVQLLSILAVAIIVLLAFRSITIPVLLVLLIQCAIWINMAFPYFTGTPLIYIGYLIISSIQLGATIDYAILMTNRYTEYRKLKPAKEAALAALNAAGPSVLVSMLILAGAGFAESIVSNVASISEIGLLLGRGALLSGFMVLVVLPPLLCMLDKVLLKGTLKEKGVKQ